VRELHRGLIAAALAALALAVLGTTPACTTRVTLGEDDPHTYPDGAVRIRCGLIDCPRGTVCCNAGCGLCAIPGMCPSASLTCTDGTSQCGADLVSLSGGGSCVAWVWSGVTCEAVVGCECTGACELLQSTFTGCMEQHRSCWAVPCWSEADCAAGSFCARQGCEALPGLCTLVPDSCADEPHVATCGCDGVAYLSECDAHQHSVGVRGGPTTCGICNPPDITITTGTGPSCNASLGWSWDGVCIPHTGCGCSGECDRLERTEAACLSRYRDACRTLFSCGGVSCRRNVEYCELDAPGRCVALPRACEMDPSCACLVAAGLTTSTSCSDDGAGALRFTTP